MTSRLGRCVMMAATVLTLVAVVNVDSALAKKNKMTTTINGKRRKFKGRYVVASFSGNGTIIIGTKPARPGGTVRAVGFGCAIFPPNETFPVTPDPAYCNATYTETKVSTHPDIKSWFAVQGVTVTFEAFDGSHISGSFSGTLDSTTSSDPPVTIEGTFNTAISGG